MKPVIATDGGKPVDTSGEVEGTDVDGPFVGARALGRKLAQSELTRRCVAKQMFRFALGRLELAHEPSLDQAYNAFSASGFNVRELMVALTATEAFLHRTPHPNEVTTR